MEVSQVLSSGAVYQITNLVNGKFYIGSSVKYSIRKRNHINEFKRNIHKNKHFQNAWNKYGESNFEFKIIYRVKYENNVRHIEQFYIDTLNPEYNLAKIVGSVKGIRHTEETKRKMSEQRLGVKYSEERKLSLQGWKHTEESKHRIGLASKGNKYKLGSKWTDGQMIKRCNPVLQYSKTGEFIKEWKSIKEVGRILKIHCGDIGSVCKGKAKTAGGFVWKYVNKELQICC